MNKRTFIIALVLIASALIGWFIYISFQARDARSVSEVSIDWWGSAHADAEARAFTHWNEDDPAEVPVNCAKCHSGKAFLDYLGQDGTTAMFVDNPGAINSVITCEVCHNESADLLEIAIFPSGEEIIMGHNDALCGTCHSGNGAGTRVVSVSQGFSDDEVIPEASFITPHYAYAAATSYGAQAQVGYQYEGKTYVGQFKHADGVETCTDCHDPHSLRMRKDYENPDANLCAACHSNVIGYPDYRDVFVDGIDYDGDGTIEGLYHEIQGMQDILMMAIQAYSNQTLEQPIGWADQFPYLFKDLNNDGTIDSDEAAFPNRYDVFTPRLLRAGFNYQFSVKDSAGYVHNGKYMLQLLYDAIEDLAQIVEVDMSALVRPL